MSQQPVRFIIEYGKVDPRATSVSLVLTSNRIPSVPITQIVQSARWDDSPSPRSGHHPWTKRSSGYDPKCSNCGSGRRPSCSTGTGPGGAAWSGNAKTAQSGDAIDAPQKPVNKAKAKKKS